MGRRYDFEDPRTNAIIIRVTDKERKAFRELSEKSGKSLSRMVRENLMREYMRVVLGKDDF